MKYYFWKIASHAFLAVSSYFTVALAQLRHTMSKTWKHLSKFSILVIYIPYSEASGYSSQFTFNSASVVSMHPISQNTVDANYCWDFSYIQFFWLLYPPSVYSKNTLWWQKNKQTNPGSCLEMCLFQLFLQQCWSRRQMIFQ